jgi:hypothetical protein
MTLRARRLSILLVLGVASTACDQKTPAKIDYPLKAVPFTQVEIDDAFWSPRQEANRRISIQHSFKRSDESGTPGDDRLIEGAAFILAKGRDPELEKDVDARIERLIAALDAKVTDPEKTVLVSGHFFEDAVAYFKATGKRRMLDAAIRYADRMDTAYGPGKKTFISGHERLKIGLIALFRETGDPRYWKLAKFFLDERGRAPAAGAPDLNEDAVYAQAEKPVIERTEATGHCVRATYLYIPLTDIAALTGEAPYLQADKKIWEDVVARKMYLTGGIGSIRFHEQFGAAYELPNVSAWNETCASYGNIVWNHRLFLLEPEAKYIDVLERVLYNGFLVGVSLTGDRFFYQNPLVSYGGYERFDWINVACCPPNIIRLIASLGSYIYAQTDSELYVNLFIAGNAAVKLGENEVKISQETRYPWDGKVRMTIEPSRKGTFDVLVRIPGWARELPVPSDLYEYMEPFPERPALSVNGRPVEVRLENGYARLRRAWSAGDTIELDLPMSVRRVQSNWNVPEDKGRIALERGPLVYCAEAADNGGHALNLLITDDATFKSEFRADLLGGIEIVTGGILAISRGDDGLSVDTKRHPLTAIPYYAWANRGMGEMAVWIPRRGDRAWIKPVPPDPIAKVTAAGAIEKTWTGYNDQIDDISAIYDGREPLSSADESYLYFRMRSKTAEPVWIEYDLRAPTEISSASVYFADDRRFCRLPASWRVLVREGGSWKAVPAEGPSPVARDAWNSVAFKPVRTTAVRLEIEAQAVPYKAGRIGPPDALFIGTDIVWRECGVIEWRIK